MITIAGKILSAQEAETGYADGSIEKTVVKAMSASAAVYRFRSADSLNFELRLRGALVAASRELFRSGLGFAVFREAKCNPEFWDRTAEGGFLLKSGVSPAEAILNIYQSGGSYATECATAMMIVSYKALLQLYGPSLFDRTFPKIELMDWHHIDPLLREVGFVKKRFEYFPGDRRYFANPDVDPLTPQWQGENVIELGGDRYYGHGIGIRSAESILRSLDANRISGADEAARLLDAAGRPDFQRLAEVTENSRS